LRAARPGERRVRGRIEQRSPDLLNADLRRLHREVDRGDDATAAVADRRGDRPQARFELLVDDRVALLAHAGKLRLELRACGDRLVGQRHQLELVEELGALALLQAGQKHAPHRGGVGRQPGAHADHHIHDPARRHAGDIDHGLAVEDGDRRGLANLLDEPLEVRLGHVRQSERREVGEAELEHPGRQRETPAGLLHVAEALEREHEAARCRARELAGAGDVAQRHRLGAVQRADHRQPARERLDEVPGRRDRLAHDGGSSRRTSSAIAKARLATGRPA
jgi:hypothetical protein